MTLTANESLKIKERFGYSVQEIDEMILAIKDVKNIFSLAYEAASRGFSDEVMLHCGIGEAKLTRFYR